jgi:hypothetical protein
MLVSPPVLIIKASQVTKVQRLEIENRGSIRLDVHIRLEGLAQRANGSSLLEPYAPYSAVNWVTVAPSHLQVSPGTRRYVSVRFQLPRHPEPGDHHVAIIFMTPPQPGRGNIHIAGGIGVPTIITVPGSAADHVSVTSLVSPGFAISGPIVLTATVRESGTIHHSFTGPHGRLIARSGGAIIMWPPITVLRDSTVNLVTRWMNPPFICICHITTTVVSDGHRSVAAATVVIFPLVQLLAGIGVLVALVLAFLLARRYRRGRLTAAFEAGRQRGGDFDEAIGGRR